jgi:hypothetical protein
MSRRVHEREQIVTGARRSLHEKCAEWMREGEGLTNAEFISVVTGVFSDVILDHTRLMIRLDRHGDVDTPGAWAGVDSEASGERGIDYGRPLGWRTKDSDA